MENFYIEDWFPLIMFASLGILVFSGLPVAFVISGIGIAFGFLGMAYDVFSFVEFFNIVSRIWGGIAEPFGKMPAILTFTLAEQPLDVT